MASGLRIRWSEVGHQEVDSSRAEVPARHHSSGALPGTSNWEETLEYT